MSIRQALLRKGRHYMLKKKPQAPNPQTPNPEATAKASEPKADAAWRFEGFLVGGEAGAGGPFH